MEKLLITLKAARVNAGLTQEEAASALGISRRTISRYETGQSMPDVETIKKIEALYNLSYNDILFSRQEIG